MHTPAVTVILSVYNSAAFLRASIESVLAQTFTDFELLCVDDGSTDRSLSIVEEYVRKDARVRLVQRPNGGPAAAGNTGLEHARADLIARLDSDDIAFPTRLGKQVTLMRERPDVVLVGCDYQLIDEHGYLLTTIRQPTDDAELQRRCLIGKTPIVHPGCMFRREAAQRVGGYRVHFQPSEDIDLYLRLGEIGTMSSVPDVLIQYRQHASSQSESKQRVQMENTRRACEEAWHRRGLTNMTFEGKSWRADATRRSLYDQHMQFGWWAFNSKTKPAVSHYAWRGIRLMPWRAEAWKLLACGMFKL